MSHPYWPQPGYLYRRSNPHAPAPQPMGCSSCGSFAGEPLGPQGVFKHKIPWALPSYVSGRSPLYGYGGFGGDIQIGNMVISCDVKGLIEKIADVIINFQPIKLGLSVDFTGSLKKSLRSAIVGKLSSLGVTVLDGLMVRADAGVGEFTNYFSQKVAPVIATATKEYGLDAGALTSLLASQIYNLTVGYLNSCKQQISQQQPQSTSMIEATMMDITGDDRYFLDLKPDELATKPSIDPRFKTATMRTSTPGGTTGRTTGNSNILPLAIGAAAIAFLALRR